MKSSNLLLALVVLFGIPAISEAGPSICDRSVQVRKLVEAHFDLPCDRLRESDLMKIEDIRIGTIALSNPAAQKIGDYDGFTNLRALEVTNEQGSIPPGLFRELSSTRSLMLGFQFGGDDQFPMRLKSLNSGYLEGLRNLRYFTYSGSIDTIEKDTFINTPHLDYIDLTSSQVNQIERGAFRGLKKLRGISIEGGLFENGVIRRAHFEDIPQIMDLELSWRGGVPNSLKRNGIKWIEPGAIDNKTFTTTILDIRLDIDQGVWFNGSTFGAYKNLRRLSVFISKSLYFDPNLFFNLSPSLESIGFVNYNHEPLGMQFLRDVVAAAKMTGLKCQISQNETSIGCYRYR